MSSVTLLMREANLHLQLSGFDLDLEPLRRDADDGGYKLTLVQLETLLHRNIRSTSAVPPNAGPLARACSLRVDCMRLLNQAAPRQLSEPVDCNVASCPFDCKRDSAPER